MTREQRAERALEVLNNPIYKESLETLKQTYVKAFRQCNFKDDEGRWKYQVALDVIDGVESHLTAVLNLGKLDPKQGQEFQTDTIAKRITRIF
jgi:hypothetical protein